jgi:hypothetical protein
MGKGEMLTNRDVNKCLHKLSKISFLCILNISGLISISGHETWDQLFLYVVFSICFVFHREGVYSTGGWWYLSWGGGNRIKHVVP